MGIYAENECYQFREELRDKGDQWLPWSFQAKYCHSEVVQGNCMLNVSQHIIIIIIFCNSIKMVIMVMMALDFKDRPLTILGDAIQSKHLLSSIEIPHCNSVQRCVYNTLLALDTEHFPIDYNRLELLGLLRCPDGHLRFLPVANGSHARDNGCDFCKNLFILPFYLYHCHAHGWDLQRRHLGSLPPRQWTERRFSATCQIGGNICRRYRGRSRMGWTLLCDEQSCQTTQTRASLCWEGMRHQE